MCEISLCTEGNTFEKVTSALPHATWWISLQCLDGWWKIWSPLQSRQIKPRQIKKVCLGKIVLQFIAQFFLCIWHELHHYVLPSISWWDGSTSLKGTFRQSTRQFWDWSWNDQILAVKVEIHRGFQVSELTFFWLLVSWTAFHYKDIFISLKMQKTGSCLFSTTLNFLCKMKSP